MRVLTLSAIGLALALPLAVASAPARADNGDLSNQNAHHVDRQNDQNGYGQRADNFSDRQGDQRPGQAYNRDRYDHGQQQAAEGDQNRQHDQYGQRQDQYRHDHADSGQHAQADGYHRGGPYESADRGNASNGPDHMRSEHQAYDGNDISNHD